MVELHDCFAHNELITYEALGLCPEGGAEKFIDDGDNTYGGKFVTNPSGGLLSKGHPLGATGLAQCYELTRQLRGTAGATPGRWRAAGTAAQSRPRRRLRRDAVRARLRPDHGRSIRCRAQLYAGHRARRARTAALLPRYARRTQSGLSRRGGRARRRLFGDAGAADLSVLPGDDGRRTAVRIPRPRSTSTSPACCTASSASPITRPSWSATR